MTIQDGKAGQSYHVGSVEGNEKNKTYLLTLGIFAGSTLTIITKTQSTYIISVKDGRYAIDHALAGQICLIPSRAPQLDSPSPIQYHFNKYSDAYQQAFPQEEILQRLKVLEQAQSTWLQQEVSPPDQSLKQAQQLRLEARARTLDARLHTVEARLRTLEAKARTQEARQKTQEARTRLQLARLDAQRERKSPEELESDIDLISYPETALGVCL